MVHEWNRSGKYRMDVVQKSTEVHVMQCYIRLYMHFEV